MNGSKRIPSFASSTWHLKKLPSYVISAIYPPSRLPHLAPAVGWAHSCSGAINRTRRFHEIYAVVVHVLDPSPNPTSEKNCNCHVLFIGRGGNFAVLQPVCSAFSAHFRRAYKKSNQLVLLVGHPLSEFRSKIKKINGRFEFFFGLQTIAGAS